MSQAMFQMSVERNPAVRSADGGPFDISELWSAGGSQPSATQSETSGVGQGTYTCRHPCCLYGAACCTAAAKVTLNLKTSMLTCVQTCIALMWMRCPPGPQIYSHTSALTVRKDQWECAAMVCYNKVATQQLLQGGDLLNRKGKSARRRKLRVGQRDGISQQKELHTVQQQQQQGQASTGEGPSHAPLHPWALPWVGQHLLHEGQQCLSRLGCQVHGSLMRKQLQQ
jgi:hypothetical protein